MQGYHLLLVNFDWSDKKLENSPGLLDPIDPEDPSDPSYPLYSYTTPQNLDDLEKNLIKVTTGKDFRTCIGKLVLGPVKFIFSDRNQDTSNSDWVKSLQKEIKVDTTDMPELDIEIGDGEKSEEYSLKDSSLDGSPAEAEKKSELGNQVNFGGGESTTADAKTSTEKDTESLEMAGAYSFPEKIVDIEKKSLEVDQCEDPKIGLAEPEE